MKKQSYNDLIDLVKNYGQETKPRDKPTIEIVNLSVEMSTGILIKRRGMNVKLAFVEGLMLIGGFFDLDLIKAVAPNANHKLFERQSDYGERVRTQVPLILDELMNDNHSRRAVLQFNGTLHTGTDNIACTLTSQYLMRQFLFSSTYTMRSWDLALGFPNDIVMFSMLTQAIHRVLGGNEFSPSTLRINAMSAHLYHETMNRAIVDYAEGEPTTYMFELPDDRWPRTWPEIQAKAKALAYDHEAWGGYWPKGNILMWATSPDCLIF